MKKYLLGLFALVFALGMSAFTSPQQNSTDVYDWVSASDPGDTFTGTRDEAILHYDGCDTGTDLCAAAFEEGTQIRAEDQDLKFVP